MGSPTPDRCTHRPEFLEALGLLAQACGRVRAAGRAEPILVGGAVVEWLTGGAICSGDFDFVAAAPEAFAGALVSAGFVRGDGLRLRTGCFWHPRLPLGVEMVSGAYFDGRGERARARRVEAPGGGCLLAAPAEDMIADRLGQWAACGGTDGPLLLQAVAMFALAPGLDRAYLDRRIREDTSGDLDLAGFERLCAARALGVAPAGAMRNTGARRTRAKRLLLERIAAATRSR